MKKILWLGIILFMTNGIQIQAADAVVNTNEKMKQSDTKYFTFWGQRSLANGEADALRGYLMEVRRGVGDQLGIYPEETFQVVLTSADVFHNYSKAPSHVAGMFDGKIHIPAPSDMTDTTYLKSILWHEYTHAAIYSYTKGPVPRWVNEGIATYMQSKILSRNVSELSKSFRSNKRLPFSISELESTLEQSRNVSPEIASLAYDEAYVAAKVLFEKYQISTIREFIKRSGKEGVESALNLVLNLTPQQFESAITQKL